MFKKDSWISGLLIGLGILIVGVAIIYAIIPVFQIQGTTLSEKIYMLALIPNILTLRWFYKNKSLIKTGHGVLVITIIATIGYLFWLKFGLQCAII